MAEQAAGHLPPGFHFLPSDDELVNHFLHNKVTSLFPFHPSIIPTLDLHLFDPWDLHCKALNGAGNYWYFFTQRTHNRETPNGCWKQVGVDEPVKEVGIRKTFVFKAGNGLEEMKKDWVMDEFCLVDSFGSSSSSRKSSQKKGYSTVADGDKWVVCRVYETCCGFQPSSEEDGTELSCLDQVFLSFDDYDEVSFPN
ncbi:NAC domain-containing protein 104-like [Dendrobium catenatum]|uniref:NAC transcription factor NAM-A1 n=1 Tax=Dendrobium catenatum TaxID=906689 RepID=A0A2I0V9Z1_9ASPA|nr:NAC domain-containing protein 104-like [Dendrobium catenatum]PKU60235.1 NAC transcription factor NAM-A1 [Dendrobium catenatum]